VGFRATLHGVFRHNVSTRGNEPPGAPVSVSPHPPIAVGPRVPATGWPHGASGGAISHSTNEQRWFSSATLRTLSTHPYSPQKWQFLLEEPPRQVWALMLAYIRRMQQVADAAGADSSRKNEPQVCIAAGQILAALTSSLLRRKCSPCYAAYRACMRGWPTPRRSSPPHKRLAYARFHVASLPCELDADCRQHWRKTYLHVA
jgi:hypothetical protein